MGAVLQRALGYLDRGARGLLLIFVRAYQGLLSPLLPRACRFEPSCSHYACGCLQKHSLGPALFFVLRRLASCHPFHPGGYDPVPAAQNGEGEAASAFGSSGKTGAQPGLSSLQSPSSPQTRALQGSTAATAAVSPPPIHSAPIHLERFGE